MTVDCIDEERRVVRRISTFLRIFQAHAICLSACIYAQTAPSPNEMSADVPHTGSPWINVVSYGAKADGITDDTTAISSAMTACTPRAVPNNGCVSDSNGYVKSNPATSPRAASGFVLKATGRVYVGDKVTSYRGRLPDENFTTEWPYTLKNPNQSTIDICYDSTNKPAPTVASLSPGIRTSALGSVRCIKSPGPPVVIGFCSTKVSSSGSCTCN